MIPQNNKKPVILILLIVQIGIVFFVWGQPALRSLLSTTELIRTALKGPVPTITLLSKGISLEGQLPTRIHLRDNIWLIFDTSADSTELLSCAPRSIWLSNDRLLYRTKEGVRSFDLNKITSDAPPKTFTGKEIRDKFEKYYRPGKTLIFVLSVFTALIFLFLLVLIGGGIGIIVDAFKEGPSTYGQMVLLSAKILTIWVIIAAGVKFAGIFSLRMLAAFLFLYLISVALFVNYNLNHKINLKSSI